MHSARKTGMSRVAATLLLLLCLAAPTPEMRSSARPTEKRLALFTRQFSDLPDYDTYRYVERVRSEQAQRLRADDGGNASSRKLSLPAAWPRKPSWLAIGGDSGPGDAPGPDYVRQLLQFMQDHQLIFYMACSSVLTGVVLLVTLMALYGARHGSSWRTPWSGRQQKPHGELYALLDRQPLLAKGRSALGDDDVDDDEEATARNDMHEDARAERRGLLGLPSGSAAGSVFEISTLSEIGAGEAAATWSEPDEPAEGLWRSEQAVKRPIEVFPGRLLDLCNQEAPLTFLAFLPSGSQGRCKWLAHGRHSEVFQLVSVLRRTVLKVVPVTADFSQQRVDAIAAAIECSVKLSMLRHGMRYRAPNFIEVQRIACVFDQFPKWLLSGDGSLGSRDSLAESSSSEISGTNQCFLTRHFIVFELCYAGKPLSHITLRSAVQGRSLVLQASCCVAVAERALGFQLTGAGEEKLLVAFTDAASLEYCLPDRPPLSVDSAGLRAHLAGLLTFELGPEEDSDDDLALHNIASGSAFSKWSAQGAQRFYSNVMWLGAVLDCVVRKLRSEVPESRARNERSTLEELLAWQGRLKRCHSAGEFVASLDL